MVAARAHYLDAAKVISACLVVYWHTVFTDAAINVLLLPVRMPLFFLVSGFFAQKAMRLDWQTFGADKFLRLIYLYVVWSAILFFSLEMLVAMMKGQPISVGDLLTLFVDPPRTIWFLYALALAYLIGYLTWRLPRHLVVLAGFAIYFVPDLFLAKATDGDFIVRLCKLVPFFLLALRYGDECRALIEWKSVFGFMCAAAYFPLTIAVQKLSGMGQSACILIASAVGLVGILNLLWRAQDLPLMRGVSSFGSASIFIFLLHRYTITACNFLAAKLDHTINAWSGLLIAALAVVISVLVGRRIIRPFLPWLEQPIWKRPQARQMAE